MTRQSILQLLDESAREFRFPGFDNMNYYLGTARLNAFRSPQHWAIVLEEILWWPAADGIQQELFVFGTGLPESELAFPGQPNWQQGLIYWPHSPLECGFEEDGELSLEGLSIRGQAVELRAEQIPPQPEVPERGFAVMVYLIEHYREQLMCSLDELRRVVPPDFELVAQLDQWHHPHVYAGELPSQNPTFQNLAQLLAGADPGPLRTNEEGNVDWRRWMVR
jgi:hypothetical protein